MKRFAILISMLLVATALVAQEPEAKLRTKLFEVHNRNARDIALAVKGLASGTKGGDVSWNDQLQTITVRDFPENVAAIEEAIGRLDRPMAAQPDFEMKISILIGSKTALSGAPVPDDLAPVVKQLQSTLKYSHYGLMAANIQHSKAGDIIEGSGVAEATLVGMTPSADHPIFYNYRLRNIRVESAGERKSIGIEKFEFGMRVPVKTDKVQYQNVGFETPVSVREGEKVVIGTTTMGDRAVIVVLTANIGGK